MGLRYYFTGVNPFRELKQATLGESIEIKEYTDAERGTYHQLMIDNIDRGIQFGDAKRPDNQIPGWNWKRQPITYYHVNSPVGFAFGKHNWCTPKEKSLAPGDARLPASIIGMLASDPIGAVANAWSEPPVGVIFMGCATLAGYARPFQFFDYYESNPHVKKLSVADNPAELRFTYLADALKRGANVRVFDGPERQTFDREAPTAFYRLLIVETSHGHSDLPSRELLTVEAMKRFVDSLSEDGVICFHTSSRSFDLPRLLATVCNRLQLSHLRINDGNNNRAFGEYTSEWFMVARDDKHLDYLKVAANLRNLHAPAPNPRNGMAAGVRVSQVPAMDNVQWFDNGPNSLRSVRR